MTRHDLIVIGGGPGGYVAAIRAAQLGMRVACVDENPRLGGTCLRVGCIPSKALLESSERYEMICRGLGKHGIKLPGEPELDLGAMLRRKDGVVSALTKGIDGLFKKNGVSRYQGRARLQGETTVLVEGPDEGEYEAGRIILAPGSKPAVLPGVEVDGGRIGTSTEALAYPEVPEHLVVIGAGYIGLELGSVWRRLGAKVTVLEFLPRLLPGMDTELAEEAQKIFKKQGLEFHLESKVTGAAVEGDGCVVHVEGRDPLHCDRVLCAAGRLPNTSNLGLESVPIEVDEKGRIAVDDEYRTSCPSVYAIGDAIAGPMLAHKAEEEGMACVDFISSGYGHVNYGAIPGVVYTHPELASVGKTEEALQEEGISYRKGTFPFMANGRARALDDTQGWVKVLADDKTDRLLGVHIIGPRAGDLIAESATAMAFGASSEDLASACHAHPTLAEALKEAALAVDERAIHI